MKKKSVCLFVVVCFMIPLSLAALSSENNEVKKANYELAARFSPAKLKKMVFSTTVDPHWLKYSDRFWYTYETSEGKVFFISDPAQKTKKPLFDNVKMAAMLTEITKDPYDAKHLPIKEIEFVKKDAAIQFEVKSSLEEEEEERDEEMEKEKMEEQDEEEDKKEK
jgi:dipeptidyl-peptidase-4